MGSGLCSGDRSVWKLSGWLSAWCRDMPELCLLEPWRNGGECFGKDKNEVPEGISYYPQLHWYGWDDLGKSTIAAHAGEKVLIPINMRDGSVWRWEKAIQNSSSSQNRISINSSGMSPKSGEIESRLMLRTSAIFKISGLGIRAFVSYWVILVPKALFRRWRGQVDYRS